MFKTRFRFKALLTVALIPLVFSSAPLWAQTPAQAQVRVVDFRNCIVIMTSNIGSDLLLQVANSDDAILKSPGC